MDVSALYSVVKVDYDLPTTLKEEQVKIVTAVLKRDTYCIGILHGFAYEKIVGPRDSRVLQHYLGNSKRVISQKPVYSLFHAQIF